MRFDVSETYKSGCFSEYDENRSQTIFPVWLFRYAGEGHTFCSLRLICYKSNGKP